MRILPQLLVEGVQVMVLARGAVDAGVVVGHTSGACGNGGWVAAGCLLAVLRAALQGRCSGGGDGDGGTRGAQGVCLQCLGC